MLLGSFLRVSWICLLAFGSGAAYPAKGQTSGNTAATGGLHDMRLYAGVPAGHRFGAGSGASAGVPTGHRFSAGSGASAGAPTGYRFSAGSGASAGAPTGYRFSAGSGASAGAPTGYRFSAGSGASAGAPTGYGFGAGSAGSADASAYGFDGPYAYARFGAPVVSGSSSGSGFFGANQPAGGAYASFNPNNWMPARPFPDFNVWGSNVGVARASASETSPLPASSYIIQSRNGFDRAMELLSHAKYSPDYPEPAVLPANPPSKTAPKGGKGVY